MSRAVKVKKWRIPIDDFDAEKMGWIKATFRVADGFNTIVGGFMATDATDGTFRTLSGGPSCVDHKGQVWIAPGVHEQITGAAAAAVK